MTGGGFATWSQVPTELGDRVLSHLTFIFQKEEKLTTKRYLIKLRMEKAMELLKSGEYKVGEVSNKVGYPNQLHFSSEFKKYYGSSPLKYLEKEGTK